MKNSGTGGTVGANLHDPHNAPGIGIGGDSRDNRGIRERLGGIRTGCRGDGGVGDGVLAEVVADDGDVQVAVPVGDYAEDAGNVTCGVESLREDFLDVVVAGTVELAEIGLVEEVEAAGLAGGDSEIGMGNGAHRGRENQDAAGTEIDVVGAQSVLVRGSEEIQDRAGGGEFNDGVAEVDGAIEGAVAGFDPDVAGRIDSGAGASAPDSAFGVGTEVGGGPDEGLSESGLTIAHDPAVPGVVIAVRAERDVDRGVVEEQGGTLHVVKNVETGGSDFGGAVG